MKLLDAVRDFITIDNINRRFILSMLLPSRLKIKDSLVLRSELHNLHDVTSSQLYIKHARDTLTIHEVAV